MKKLDVPQSGSQADTTASRNRFGQYNRTRATPVNPNTVRQTVVRGLLTDASQAWRELTSATRAAWNAFALTAPVTDSLGQTIYPSGHQRFVGFFVAMSTAGLTVPPAVPTEAPPVPPIITAFTALDTALAIAVTGTVSASAPLLVYASPPVSPGVSYNGDYRYLQTFTALTMGEADFEAAWVAKFGAPQVGRRIFVRAVSVTEEGGVSAPAYIDAVVEAA